MQIEMSIVQNMQNMQNNMQNMQNNREFSIFITIIVTICKKCKIICKINTAHFADGHGHAGPAPAGGHMIWNPHHLDENQYTGTYLFATGTYPA